MCKCLVNVLMLDKCANAWLMCKCANVQMCKCVNVQIVAFVCCVSWLSTHQLKNVQHAQC